MDLTVETDLLDLHQMNLCMELANRARINCSYVIGCDPARIRSDAFLTSSFSEAFAIMRRNELESLSVIFDWKLGERSGMGWIPYDLPASFVVDEDFVLRSIRCFIRRRIAEDLYKYLDEPSQVRPASEDVVIPDAVVTLLN